MRNIKLVVEYDGTDFSGFQRIPGRRTIQGEIEEALRRVMKENVRIAAAGRTDAGVHALGQAVSFQTACAIPMDRVAIALNSVLPADISVRSAVEAPPEFHARYSALSRTYRYTILNSESPCAVMRRYTLWVRRRLDENAMRCAARSLVGTHDFASFCVKESDDQITIRELRRAEVVRVGDLVSVTLKANSFLWRMARIIVGTLIQVGEGRLAPSEIAGILTARDRRRAGKTAAAAGLCLAHVEYPDYVGKNSGEIENADYHAEG